MAGTREGGLKAKAKNLASDPDFYRKIGRQGGLKGAGPEYRKGGEFAIGFAANPTLARLAAAKGGRISRRKRVVR